MYLYSAIRARKVIDDNRVIINNPKEINEELAKTIEEIQADEKWGYLSRKDFPKLPNLTIEQREDPFKNYQVIKQ